MNSDNHCNRERRATRSHKRDAGAFRNTVKPMRKKSYRKTGIRMIRKRRIQSRRRG